MAVQQEYVQHVVFIHYMSACSASNALTWHAELSDSK